MKAEDFDLPHEFARYEKYIQEDFERFFSVFSKYKEQGNTFFQSIVYTCDDLANHEGTPEENKDAYSEIALLGYFLLSQFKRVLAFPIKTQNFEINYFRFKSAIFTGERGTISAILANIMTALVDLKKKDASTHSVFFTIMSIEIASMNSDIESVRRYSTKIRDLLFDTILIQDYPLITLQIVSELPLLLYASINLHREYFTRSSPRAIASCFCANLISPLKSKLCTL